MKISFFIIAFLALFSLSGFALNFPTGFSVVNQTYGDYDGGKYHVGIDMAGSENQEVHSPFPSGRLIGKDKARDSRGCPRKPGLAVFSA